MTKAYDESAMQKSLAKLRSQPIEATEKGFTALGPITSDEVLRRGVFLHDLTLPVMVLRDLALTANVETMAAWCRDHGVLLAPHGKTTMSPELTARQLRAGAWGITAATITQVAAFVETGVRRVLLANQLVDPAGIAWLARALREFPDLTVIGYVDSIAGVQLLDRELEAQQAPRPVPVLVELGVPGRRTGARSVDEALEVADAAAGTATLQVSGASAFEGVLGHGRDARTLEAVGALCRDVRSLGLQIAEEPIVSAGGSTFFDVVAQELSGPEPTQVVLRSGGYVTHDDGLYSVATPLPSGGLPYALDAAIDVWAHVLSRPEPGRALVGAGRRDVPFDVALPVVRAVESATGRRRDGTGLTVSSLNDQHAFLDVPETSDLAVGDRVCFGIAHPCTAFDKWRGLPIVDADGRIVDFAHTLF